MVAEPYNAKAPGPADTNLSSRPLGPGAPFETLVSERSGLSRELQQRVEASQRMLAFAQRTHGNFIVGGHHREICDALEKVDRGEIDRLMIFAPPRHGKSELVSFRFPAWYLGRHPDRQIITASYSDELADDFGRKVRNLIAEPEYRNIFPALELAQDSRAAGRWHTNSGGVYTSAGILGGFVGRGAHVFVIDDPFRNREEADSERIRDKVWNVFESDIQSRLMPGGSIILMHTRWHVDDLAGRLLEAMANGGDKWHVLSFPAIWDENTDNERSLWPEWFSLEDMRRRRSNSDTRTWNALYQQNPQPDQGTYYQREWFQRYKFGEEPKALNVYISSDFAVTEGDGDYTEHGVWGMDSNDNLWALAWWYGQTTSDVWIDHLIDLIGRYKPLAWFGEAGVIRRAIEPTLIRRMRERRIYCRTEYLPSIHDKPTRARGFQARASMKKVYVPNVPWGNRLVDQLVTFPSGKHDDAADVCALIAQAIDQAHPAILRRIAQANKADRWDRAFSRARHQANALGWKVV